MADPELRLEWGAEGIAALGPTSDVLVIVDVLSFCTCVDVAVGRGAEVFPFRTRDEAAEAFAAERGARLAGRRGEGRFSLSPGSLEGLEAGERLVLPSPNGATLSLAAVKHGETVAGCLRNAVAVAAHCRQRGGRRASGPTSTASDLTIGRPAAA